MPTPPQQPAPPPSAPPPTGPAFGSGAPYTPQLDYASFGRRAGALLVDSLVIMVVYAVAAAIIAGLYFVLTSISEGLAVAVAVILGLAAYVGSLVWFMLLEAGPFGQTLGKRLLNIRVVDTRGQALSKGGSVGRYFAKIISYMPLYIGFLWPLWDKERRTFHDMILDTRVIRAGDSPPLGAVAMAPFKRGNAASG